MCGFIEPILKIETINSITSKDKPEKQKINLRKIHSFINLFIYRKIF